MSNGTCGNFPLPPSRAATRRSCGDYAAARRCWRYRRSRSPRRSQLESPVGNCDPAAVGPVGSDRGRQYSRSGDGLGRQPQITPAHAFTLSRSAPPPQPSQPSAARTVSPPERQGSEKYPTGSTASTRARKSGRTWRSLAFCRDDRAAYPRPWPYGRTAAASGEPFLTRAMLRDSKKAAEAPRIAAARPTTGEISSPSAARDDSFFRWRENMSPGAPRPALLGPSDIRPGTDTDRGCCLAAVGGTKNH